MGVKSARVQSVIQGDDIVFRHTLVRPASVGNNESLILQPIGMSDVVTAKYATTQPTDDSLPSVAPVSVVGVAVVGEASTFDFTLSAVESAKLLLGKAQTVRIEITQSGGDLTSLYLYDEYDVAERGFPAEDLPAISLP